MAVTLRLPGATGARRTVLPVFVLALLFWTVQPVVAKGLIFDLAQAAPGTTVRVRDTVHLHNTIPPARDVFLVPQGAGDVSAKDPRLVPLGQLVAGDDNIGRMTFTVPDVSPGEYIVVVQLPVGSGGRTNIHPNAYTVLPPGTEVPAGGPPVAAFVASVFGIGVAASTIALVGSRSLRRRSGFVLERLFVGPHTPGA